MVLALKKRVKLHINVSTVLIHAMNALHIQPHAQEGRFFSELLLKNQFDLQRQESSMQNGASSQQPVLKDEKINSSVSRKQQMEGK